MVFAGRAPDRWLVAGLGIVLVAAVPRLFWVLPNEDAGVIGAWAMQAAAGQVPYRDFFVFTTPGAVALYAGLFKVVGATYLAERALTLVAILAACWAGFELGRTILPAPWSAAVMVLWGVWLGVYLQYGPHHFWGTALLLFMALAVVRKRFAVAGVCGSLAVAFIQSAVAAVALAVLAAVLVQPAWRRSAAPMLIAAGIAALPWLGWLLAAGALPAAFDYTILYSLRYYPATNAVPFPWLPTQLLDTTPYEASAAGVWAMVMSWLLVVLAPVLIAGTVAWALIRGRHRPAAGWLVLAVLSTGLFLSVLTARLTAPLGWFAAPLALILVAARVRILAGGRLLPLAPAGLIVLGGLAPAPLGYALSCQLNPHSPWRPIAAQGGTLCAHQAFSAGMGAAHAFVVAHPHQGIAFLPIASSYYLVAGEAPPVPDVWVIPGLEAPGQVNGLEQALLARRVRYVVYFSANVLISLPEDRALRGSGGNDFDPILERDYQRIDGTTVGGLPVWELRADAGASDGRAG